MPSNSRFTLQFWPVSCLQIIPSYPPLRSLTDIAPEKLHKPNSERIMFQAWVFRKFCQGCRFFPYTFSETIRHRWYLQLDLNIGETRVWWLWFRAKSTTSVCELCKLYILIGRYIPIGNCTRLARGVAPASGFDNGWGFITIQLLVLLGVVVMFKADILRHLCGFWHCMCFQLLWIRDVPRTFQCWDMCVCYICKYSLNPTDLCLFLRQALQRECFPPQTKGSIGVHRGNIWTFSNQ